MEALALAMVAGDGIRGLVIQSGETATGSLHVELGGGLSC